MMIFTRNPLWKLAIDHDILAQDASISVQVFRMPDETGWVLAIVDAAGYATVWDEPFPSKKAALLAAQTAIETEGAYRFEIGSGDIGPELLREGRLRRV